MSDTEPIGGISAERLQILRMVESQTITPEDASRLLEAIDRSDRRKVPAPPPPPVGPRNVRIQISDRASGKREIDLTLPLGVVQGALRLANKFAPGRVPDLTDVKDAADRGFVGKLVDIEDGQDHITISIEPRNS